jgi:hypothetical protein
MAYRNYSTAVSHIVDASGQGDFTTIGAALTAASSGQTIFIRPGTYTENPTLKAGVNLTAYDCDFLNPNVIISGKCTFTGSGTVAISGIQLQTNSDFALAVTGSSASVVNLTNCNVNCTNNTGISFTTSSGSANINFNSCWMNLTTTGIAYWSCSTPATLGVINCYLSNSGASTTASTTSSGPVDIYFTHCDGVISCSSTGVVALFHVDFFNSGLNTTALSISGTGISVSFDSIFYSGTASAISIGSGATLSMSNSTVSSSNTNAISGSGTLQSGVIDFMGSSSTIQSTLTFTPVAPFIVKNQVFTSSGTYTPSSGMFYCSIQCLGGGGAGGGPSSTGSGQLNSSGGGGAGEYARGNFSASSIGSSQTVTIGSAGTGSAGATGGNGGNTSVGSLITANGGSGGLSGTASSTNSFGSGGAGGTGGTGGDYRTPGMVGQNGFSILATYVQGGTGANSQLGSGALAVPSGTPNVGLGYGAGGGGTGIGGSASGIAGGNGTKGVVIVTEYILS